MKIVQINLFDRRTYPGSNDKMPCKDFLRILEIYLFGLVFDWFIDYDKWFIYLKTKNKYIRFSSCGFIMSKHVKK